MELTGNLSFDPSQITNNVDRKMTKKNSSTEDQSENAQFFDVEMAMASQLGSANQMNPLPAEMKEIISGQMENENSNEFSSSMDEPKNVISINQDFHSVQNNEQMKKPILNVDALANKVSPNTELMKTGPILQEFLKKEEVSSEPKVNLSSESTPKVSNQVLPTGSFLTGKQMLSPLKLNASQKSDTNFKTSNSKIVPLDQTILRELVGSQNIENVNEIEFVPDQKIRTENIFKKNDEESVQSNSNKNSILLSGSDFIKTVENAKLNSVSRQNVKQKITVPIESQTKTGEISRRIQEFQPLERPSRPVEMDSDFETKSTELFNQLAQSNHMNIASKMKNLEVTGHVVPGAMAQKRLTSETLMNVSNGVYQLANGGGGGEVKIRLNPKSLGEVSLNVSTIGNRVRLKINASEQSAKNILEESISSLKENLAGKNLILSKVDVNVLEPSSKGIGSDFQGNMANQDSADLNQGNQGRGYQRESRNWEIPESRFLKETSTGATTPRSVSHRLSAQGRLNVVA